MRTIVNRLHRKLNRTIGRGAVYAAVVAAIAVFALPGAANAAGDDYYVGCGDWGTSCQTGVAAGLVEGNCMTSSAAFASTQMCVKYDGDYVYVYDGQADGYAAMAYVSTREGEIQGRYCRNNHGYGTTARCNFDWVEDTDHFVQAGYKIDYATEAPLQTLWEWSGK